MNKLITILSITFSSNLISLALLFRSSEPAIELFRRCTDEFVKKAVCDILNQEASRGDEFAPKYVYHAKKVCATYESMKRSRVKFMSKYNFTQCHEHDVWVGEKLQGPDEARQLIGEIRRGGNFMQQLGSVLNILRPLYQSRMKESTYDRYNADFKSQGFREQ